MIIIDLRTAYGAGDIKMLPHSFQFCIDQAQTFQKNYLICSAVEVMPLFS